MTIIIEGNVIYIIDMEIIYGWEFLTRILGSLL